jgi:hypothetical protein
MNTAPVFDFSSVATNDKYLPYFARHYLYCKSSGVITNLNGKVIKPASDKGYVILSKKVKGRNIRIRGHRLIMFMCGHDIAGHEVDHIDGDRTNNKYDNLRLVSRSVNRRNAARSRKNTSGVSGVCWHKWQKKWEVKGLKCTIGYHDNFFDACCTRKSWENSQEYYTDRHGVVDAKY